MINDNLELFIYILLGAAAIVLFLAGAMFIGGLMFFLHARETLRARRASATFLRDANGRPYRERL